MARNLGISIGLYHLDLQGISGQASAYIILTYKESWDKHWPISSWPTRNLGTSIGLYHLDLQGILGQALAYIILTYKESWDKHRPISSWPTRNTRIPQKWRDTKVPGDNTARAGWLHQGHREVWPIYSSTPKSVIYDSIIIVKQLHLIKIPAKVHT